MRKKKTTGNGNQALWDEYWRNRDSVAAIEALIKAWMPLVYKVLERIAIRLPSHVCLDDLLQSAVIGLYYAIERYDSGRGNFKTFAAIKIRGAILDELRSADHMSRSGRFQIKKIEKVMEQLSNMNGQIPSDEELANAVQMDLPKMFAILDKSHPWLSLDQETFLGNGGTVQTLYETIPDKKAQLPDEEAVAEDVKALFRNAFRRLPSREQKILYLYYYEELKLSEIAALFELTEARISQIHAMMMMKLRTYMQDVERGLRVA